MEMNDFYRRATETDRRSTRATCATQQTMRLRPLLLLPLLALAFPLVPITVEAARNRTVVVLLFDGFAPALLGRIEAPNLTRIRGEGVWTHRMAPVFPSSSLPNQVSISTGCWPARHGIIANRFLDPERGQYDHSDDADWLLECEHLHQVAERQGVRSAALGWVGRFSGNKGEQAGIVSAEHKFAEFPEDGVRTAQVIRMLQLPDRQRPRLILAYFHGPDRPAHSTGLDSEATREAASASDKHIGEIMQAISELPFREAVTLIVTTDHGLVPASYNVNVKKILLDHELHPRVISAGSTSHLYFEDAGEADRAMRPLSRYSEFIAVRKTALPASWHLGNGPRVGDIILSAKPPYFIEDLDRWPAWLRWLGTFGPEFLWIGPWPRAAHGYGAEIPGVESIFYAWGAGVAHGRRIDNVRAIDLHPTIARLLGISPGTPLDGRVVEAVLEQ